MVKALITLSLIVLCTQTKAQQPISEQIDQLVSSYHKQGQFSGSVLVADKGQIVINKQYGHRDLAQTKSLNQQSVFEIASLSKQFTALLVTMIKEEGKISFDDHLTKYFPKLPYPEITLKHLLTHTSGLSEQKFFQWAGQNMDPKKTYHNDFVVEYLLGQQPALAFSPGSQWEYSNLGYLLLSAILQQVTGKHYITLLNERILQPLEMGQSGIYSQAHKETKLDNYAFGKIYNPKDSSYIPAFGMAWSDSLYGGVGILSNTIDLLKWDQALYSDQLVNSEAMAEMLKPYVLKNGHSSGYGLGWFVKEDSKVGGKSVGKRADHYGLWPGYESSLVRYVDHQKTIIILTNQSPSAKAALIKDISRLLFLH